MATDDEKEAEFVFFDRVGRDIVGKPLVSLLRSGRSSQLSVNAIINSVRGDNSIPRELAALVSQKFRFVVSFSSKSYLPESLESSFQVHRIDLSLGCNSRSSAMHRKPLSAGASGSGQVHVPAGSATSVSHGAVPPELLSPSDPNLVESTDDLPTDASSEVVSFFPSVCLLSLLLACKLTGFLNTTYSNHSCWYSYRLHLPRTLGNHQPLLARNPLLGI